MCDKFKSWKVDATQVCLYLVSTIGDAAPTAAAVLSAINGVSLPVTWMATPERVPPNSYLIAVVPPSESSFLQSAASVSPHVRGVKMFSSLSALRLSSITGGSEFPVVDSPSKGLRVPFFDFSWDAPMTDCLPKLDTAAEFTFYKASFVTPEDALKENYNYAPASSCAPPWITWKQRLKTGGVPCAAKQFLGATVQVKDADDIAGISGYKLPWACFPELETCPTLFHSPYCGQGKSAISNGDLSDPRLFYELGMYCTLATLASHFRDVPEGCQRFYTQPPIAYGLVSISCIGYLVAFEWVGKQFMSFISQPFFLGSPSHKKAVSSLPNIDYSSLYCDVNMSGVKASAYFRDSNSSIDSVVWTMEPALLRDSDAPGRFYKILRASEFDAGYLRRLHSVYTAYAQACLDEADPMPSSLLKAQLLYGANQLCVSMPFIDGRDALQADFQNNRVVEALALAIVWLARHGLLFTDLRMPNVRIAAEDLCVLIDYDDMVILSSRPSTYDSFSSALCNHFASIPGYNYVGVSQLTPIGVAVKAHFSITSPG